MKNIIKKYLNEQAEKSNFDKYVEFLGEGIDPKILESLKSFVKNYIREKNFKVKFLNSCITGFAGVRTKNQVIICSPNSMTSLGDFIYTIFHELRHEEQMSTLNLQNPLTDMDLDDFESLYQKYWELEMDADKSAKEMIATIVSKLNIPLRDAKKLFKLSKFIAEYQFASNMVKMNLKSIIDSIKKMKEHGIEYTDIEDHPVIKNHLDKLEEFI